MMVLVAFGVCACNSGSTPTETTKTAGPQAPGQQSMEEGIRSNPNMPDAAKNAILGGK